MLFRSRRRSPKGSSGRARPVARRAAASTPAVSRSADDVLSETLLVCWRRLDELPAEPDQTIPWVIVVARNLLANMQRGERRRTRLVGKIIALDPPASVIDEANPDDPADAIAVRDALTQLRSADAELLRLWAWDGLESPQLATVLGISSNAAAIRLHRAKARLKEELLKAEGTAGHVRHEGGSTDGRR